MQPHAHANSADPAGRHRPKTLTVFAAAFAAGAVLAYGVDRVVDVHAVRAEPQVESEPIFVALRSLPQGAPVTVWDVALKDWPKAMLPTTALKADASLEGMVLRHPIREGQPLLSVQLVRDASPPPAATVAALPPVVAPVPLEPQRAPATSGSATTPVATRDAAPVAVAAAPAGEASPFVAASPAVAAASPPATASPAATSTARGDDDAAPAVEQRAMPAAAAAESATLATTSPTPMPAPAALAVDTDIDPQGEASGTGTAGAARAERTSEAFVTDPGMIESSTVVGLPEAVPGWVAADTTTAVTTAPVATMTPEAGMTTAPGVTPLPATTNGVTNALVAPVPSLPSTDIAGPLTGFAHSRQETAAGAASVLDRSTAAEPPTPDRRMPKHHLVVPERIALAVDASFAHVQPAPSAAETTPAVTPPTGTESQVGTAAEVGRSSPGSDTSRFGSRKPAVANPSARKPATPGRPSSGRPQAPQFRGLGAWFPQFSGGSRQE